MFLEEPFCTYNKEFFEVLGHFLRVLKKKLKADKPHISIVAL